VRGNLIVVVIVIPEHPVLGLGKLEHLAADVDPSRINKRLPETLISGVSRILGSHSLDI